MTDRARALWTVAPGVAELRDEALPQPTAGQARVRTLVSALSRGTERLVFHGLVGPSEWQRMRAPLQAGEFPFPVKYGYCAVGVVEAGPVDLIGKTVFALHPHQDVFVCDAGWLCPLPDGLDPRRAVLAANMETALNALWDAGAGPGDRIVVIGAGVVGTLVTALAAGLPGAEVTVHDRQDRRALIEALGARFTTDAATLPTDADVVFHTSASAGGLETALACCAMESTVVELSWYGDRPVTVPLGGVFHSQRVRLLSSQVGQVSPGRRPRWPHARRLRKAMDLLRDDPRLDALLGESVAFGDLPAALPRLFGPDAPGLTAVVTY